MTVSKVAGLIASIGFSRAIFVCAMCLLMVRVVTFEQLVILVLFGLALDGVPFHRVNSPKFRARKHPHWQRSNFVHPLQSRTDTPRTLTDAERSDGKMRVRAEGG